MPFSNFRFCHWGAAGAVNYVLGGHSKNLCLWVFSLTFITNHHKKFTTCHFQISYFCHWGRCRGKIRFITYGGTNLTDFCFWVSVYMLLRITETTSPHQFKTNLTNPNGYALVNTNNLRNLCLSVCLSVCVCVCVSVPAIADYWLDGLPWNFQRLCGGVWGGDSPPATLYNVCGRGSGGRRPPAATNFMLFHTLTTIKTIPHANFQFALPGTL